MPTANPLEQLRRRMLSHATPAAFAALAEEHRRAGRLDEAVAVCRDGLARYPTYVSARVTLGRALLDSGDVAGAVAELEQVVAQAPDNLAAGRALDAARAALAALPVAPAPAVEDLALHPTAAAADACAIDDEPVPQHDLGVGDAVPAEQGADPFGDALAAGPDGPQEFGLGPDWTVPERVTPAEAAMADSAPNPIEMADATQAMFAHADAPTTYFTPAPLQGDEPAGIWPVPAADLAAADAGSDPVFTWVLAPAAGTADPSSTADAAPPERAAAPSIWDEPTIETAAADAPEGDPASASPDVAAAAHAPDSADPASGASAGWDGLFVEPVSEGAAPALFAGWDAPGPSAPEPPAWGAEDTAAEARAWPFASPEAGTSAHTAAAPDWTTPEVAAEKDVAPDDEPEPGTAGSGAPESATPMPAMAAGASTPQESLWAGSVASALDEVFAHAAHPVSLEPPTHASPIVREAMADAAVEATIVDTALRDDTTPPVLVSLQQMLDSVRARRAALFTDLES